MARINQDAFAEIVATYHRCPEQVSAQLVDQALNDLQAPDQMPAFGTGIRFAGSAGLAMLMIDRVYSALEEEVSEERFAAEIAAAMQRFAEKFEEPAHLAYPHFLLHGITEPTLDRVIANLDRNARIIHETLSVREDFIKGRFFRSLPEGYALYAGRGQADDFFGICTMLAPADEPYVSELAGYVSKVSFFLDMTEQEAYVMTIQGSKPGGYELQGRANEYALAAGRLGMSPRVYNLNLVAQMLREHGLNRVRVIKPAEHGMSIENHFGFSGTYGDVPERAGFTNSDERYYTLNLFSC